MEIFFNLFSWALRCGSTRRLFPVVPRRLFQPWVNEPEYARLVTGAIGRDRGLPRTELPSFDGRALDDDELVPFQEVQLIETLIAAYDAAISDLPRVEKAYRANEEWRRYLEESWVQYREAIQNKDLGKLAFLLRNFFRNEGISGFWAHRNVFQTFAELRGPGALFSAEQILRQYFAWKESCPDSDLREVEAPSIGNPWGYRISGIRVFQPAFEYHFQAEHFRRMLSPLQYPLVVEIGGGFGGLAYQVLRRVPGVKYLGFDLPENLLIQSYFLSVAFPQARILQYSADLGAVDRALLQGYDIALLPNFMLPRVQSSLADLVVNVRSLSEMAPETIREYLSQIARIGRGFFYHENLSAPRKDKFYGTPCGNFPALEGFIRLSSHESRWPRYQRASAYPCQEELFIHHAAFAGLNSRPAN